MIWLFFAILAPILYAINNIFDKFILTKVLKNPFSYNILTMLYDLIPLAVLLLFVPISSAFPWNFFGLLGGFSSFPLFYFMTWE